MKPLDVGAVPELNLDLQQVVHKRVHPLLELDHLLLVRVLVFCRPAERVQQKVGLEEVHVPGELAKQAHLAHMVLYYGVDAVEGHLGRVHASQPDAAEQQQVDEDAQQEL